jgi:hypothetical protein
MKKVILHKMKVGAGFTLIGVGILGCFLPIIPGIPLMLAGAAIVGMEHPWIYPFKSRFDRWRESMNKKRKRQVEE